MSRSGTRVVLGSKEEDSDDGRGAEDLGSRIGHAACVATRGDRVTPGRIAAEVRGFGADFIRPGTELSSVIEKG